MKAIPFNIKEINETTIQFEFENEELKKAFLNTFLKTFSVLKIIDEVTEG